MTYLIRRLHTYVGLFNCAMLVIFGIVGLRGCAASDPREEPAEQPSDVQTIDFTAPSDADDRRVGELVYRAVAPPDVAPDENPTRNADNDLVFTFWGPNEQIQVTYLEAVHKLRCETYRAEHGEYLTRMHTMGLSFRSKSRVLRLWSIYVELSVLSLLFMVGTGAYLWLAARRKHRWAYVTLGLSFFSVFVLFVAMR